MPAPTSSIPPVASARPTAEVSARMAAMAGPSPTAGGPLSSNCPPGSNVTRLAPGRRGRRAASSVGVGGVPSGATAIHSSSMPTWPSPARVAGVPKTCSST
jgi:hypothetical protein